MRCVKVRAGAATQRLFIRRMNPMEVRTPLLSSVVVAGLLGGRPRTVEQVLRADVFEAVPRDRRGAPSGRAGAPGTANGPARSAGALRRLIAEALHVAADALYP